MAARAGVMAVAGVLALPVSAPASAQGVPVKAAVAPPTIPKHAGAKPKAVRRAPPVTAVSREEADRAARLAENRRRFFEDQQKDDAKPERVPEFGGYDAGTMSGTLSPGFKF